MSEKHICPNCGSSNTIFQQYDDGTFNEIWYHDDGWDCEDCGNIDWV